MEYLVDGYNLLHAWDRALPEKDDLERARTRLLDALADFSAREGSRVTAVFDGVDLPYPDRGAHRGLAVRFSRTPQDADRLIASCLERSHHRRDTVVVSSDNAVKNEARAMGAKSLSSREFAETLRRSPAPEPQSRDASLSRIDVEGWARIFGVDPEDGMK